MIEVIKYGPKVQKEIICPKCESQLRFLNSDIKNINGEQLYKGFFEKFKEMCDNELCDI